MKLLHILIVFIVPLQMFSQPAKIKTIDDADEHFENKNYIMAIPIYKAEMKKDWKNTKIPYRLGLCYLNTRINRAEAVTLLEQASKDPKADDEVWLNLGSAYQLNNRIEEAIACFEKYKKFNPKKSETADKKLQECANALAFMRKPANVVLQNLGKEINSDEPDYQPFTNRDETLLMFTSRRKENFGGKKQEVDGYRNSDIYWCHFQNGKWSTAANAGRGLNGTLDEQITGMNAEGTEVYLYVDHLTKFADIYYSTLKEGQTEFPKAKPFDENVNSQFETSGCVTSGGDVMFFARSTDGNSNTDLFITRKLPTGAWGIPQKLPETINTPYDEDMPFLSYDGKTLYFSSGGHNSMGGRDLFKCVWDQKTNSFSKPENLGFPINSTDDDRSICVTADNRYAYISSYRPNGFGDLDIYRVKLNVTDPVSVIYTGQVYFNDTLTTGSPDHFEVSVIVTDTKTNYEYTFIPHSVTGRLVMALPAGTYALTAHAEGFRTYREELVVEDIGPVNSERTKNIVFKPSKKKGTD